MKLIYVVDDQAVIRNGVCSYLSNAGYNVLGFADVKTEREAVETKIPDLIIQDVMLPDGNGFDFVKELRETSNVPVIFMTARISEEDRVHGFELGADDYITKPFSPKELVLRVQALFRRLDGAEKSKKTVVQNKVKQYHLDGCLLSCDESAHRILVDGHDAGLTSAEWRVFLCLINNRREVVSRMTILQNCFGYETDVYGRIADTHIKNLRSKLGQVKWIETVRGYGYRFAGNELEEKI